MVGSVEFKQGLCRIAATRNLLKIPRVSQALMLAVFGADIAASSFDYSPSSRSSSQSVSPQPPVRRALLHLEHP